jgi:ferritin-like protein
MNWGHDTLLYTDMCRVMTGIRSEKCVVRRFRHCVNITVCTDTNLGSIAHYTPRLYIAYCSWATNLYSMLLY